MKRWIFVLCNLFLILSGTLQNVKAQDNQVLDSISILLVNEGFENVTVATENDKLYIGYENRRYRLGSRGMAELLVTLSNSGIVAGNKELNIVLLDQKTPIILVKVLKDDVVNYLTGNLSVADFRSKVNVSYECEDIYSRIAKLRSTNHSEFKADVKIIPQVRTLFGDFDNPVQSNINLIPDYNTVISKGLSIKAQLILPIQNDFYFDEEGKKVRPGIISINQFVRLKDDFFLNLTAGFFDKNRAGGNFEMKKIFANGKFALGGEIGYTTDYSFTGLTTEYFEDENYLTALASFEYRYHPYDLTGRIQLGNFLFNDQGVRFDVFRQFGEVNIGFFAFMTDEVFNGGFRFSIPIPPRKYTKIKYIRVRPDEKFSWAYKAKGFPRAGAYCNTGYNLSESMVEFNPEFFKEQLIRNL